MSARGFYVANEGHVVNALPPVDITGGITTTQVWSMRNYRHATIIISLGVTGAASTVTVEECDNFTPTTHTEIAFSYYACTTASSDVLGAKTDLTATTGFATSLNNGVFYVIEIDGDKLTDGYDKLRLSFSNPGASTLACVVVILSGARWGSTQSVTEIA